MMSRANPLSTLASIKSIAPLTMVWVLAAGCGGRPPIRPKVIPAPIPTDVIVLMPDPDDGHVGAAIVSTGGDTVRLDQPQSGTRVAAGQAPSQPAAVADSEVQRLFGAALAARPPAPRHFLLYFAAGDILTSDSQAQLTQIVDLVRTRDNVDVAVIGHTDTTDNATANYSLGVRRATTIRSQLLGAGLLEDQIDVTSHGESDLLVPTADNVAEPRNRRVEVTVR